MIPRVVIIILASYFLGNLNGAILISRLLAHDDVRRHGSGNAGFTNFCRNYGALTGLLVFGIDAAKAVAACALGRVLFAPLGFGLEGAALAAVAVGLGHDFPALLGFHGGKGIVCGVASAAMLDWRVALVALGTFLVIHLITHYVSLGSITGAAALFASFALWHFDHPWAVAGCGVMCAAAIVMHRENIRRLIAGTERKTDFFKKERRQ